MTGADRRFFVRSPDGRGIFGFETREAAEYVAREYSDGAELVDTLAQAYRPMVQAGANGALEDLSYGGWDTGRFGLDRDLIEASRTATRRSSTPTSPRAPTRTRATPRFTWSRRAAVCAAGGATNIWRPHAVGEGRVFRGSHAIGPWVDNNWLTLG